MFSGVYGPNDARDKALMWDELSSIHAWWAVPWYLEGDFNVVRFPSEKVGSSVFNPLIGRCSRFPRLIDFCFL